MRSFAVMPAPSSVCRLVAVSLLALLSDFGAAKSADEPPPEAAPVAQDLGWPRQFETPDHVVRVYQPQLESWAQFDRITFRAAISVAARGSEDRTFGVLRVSADTQIAFEERLVILTDRTVESLNFPDADETENERLRTIVAAAAPPEQPQTIALDRLVAALEPDQIASRAVEVVLAPPPIFASDMPAVLVMFMGKPRFTPVPDSDLFFAINTNWDIFLDPSDSTYYLLNDGSWLATTDLDQGPWSAVATLPAAFAQLPNDENWVDVRAATPAAPAKVIPTVFVSHEPAELIVTQGAPELEPIPGTTLMLVANTDNDLFYETTSRNYYLLAAGRWFRASSLAGPWAAASASLPQAFQRIPDDSDVADVRASVPGTAEANEAIIMASIPNKATVNRADVSLEVTYDGAPDFRAIETTTVRYAHNSPFNVFLVDGAYYCCHNALWFMAPTPTGVWTLCDSVPAAIYSIPPTSPKHNVTYVYVYDSTSTTVETGYTAGYSGQTVAVTGVVMFGLGVVVGAALDDDDDCCWHYHYNSGFFSYGCGAIYHPGCGGFVCAGRVYGPYGGAGHWAAYNPATGRYSRGAYLYGPRGATGYRAAYNPGTGYAAGRVGGVTPYGSWGRSAITNGDEWVRAGHASGPRGTVRGIQTSEGAGALHAESRWGNGMTIARDEDGDFYAGSDGRVYKKTDDGWEQQRSSRTAQDAHQNQLNSAPARELQEQSRSRTRGERNSDRARQTKRGGGGSSGGRGGRRSR